MVQHGSPFLVQAKCMNLSSSSRVVLCTLISAAGRHRIELSGIAIAFGSDRAAATLESGSLSLML